MALGGVFLILLLAVIAVFFFLRARQGGVVSGDRIGDGLRILKANKTRYATLTREMLSETPDEELVSVVLYNLWAKMDDTLSDAQQVLSGLSQGRMRIFALYAFTGGVMENGMDKTLNGPDGVFAQECASGLVDIGAENSAEVLRGALAAGADAKEYEDTYLEAFQAEDGRARMALYIREHLEQFVDLS